jgi:hypothetical protein
MSHASGLEAKTRVALPERNLGGWTENPKHFFPRAPRLVNSPANKSVGCSAKAYDGINVGGGESNAT